MMYDIIFLRITGIVFQPQKCLEEKMASYLGYKCVVCGQAFSEKDDIVVCPECGTPYHRECYEKSGKCINEELHKTGESWQKKTERENKESGYKKCPYCETMNKPHSIICENCGAPLVEDLNKNMNGNAGGFTQDRNSDSDARGQFTNAFGFDPADKYCGMDPDEEFESVKLRDLSEFVGTNQIYYLPIFRKMRDTKQKISLNIVSFFLPQLYFANRKMWLWALISIIISTILSLPYIIFVMADSEFAGSIFSHINVSSGNFSMLYNITSVLSFVFQAFMLLFSNWLYYRHALNKIKRIKSSDGTDGYSEPDGQASGKKYSCGGTSTAGIFISIGVQMAVGLLVVTLLTR